MLVGEEDELDVLDAVPEAVEHLLEDVERAAGVQPVSTRERVASSR